MFKKVLIFSFLLYTLSCSESAEKQKIIRTFDVSFLKDTVTRSDTIYLNEDGQIIYHKGGDQVLSLLYRIDSLLNNKEGRVAGKHVLDENLTIQIDSIYEEELYKYYLNVLEGENVKLSMVGFYHEGFGTVYFNGWDTKKEYHLKSIEKNGSFKNVEKIREFIKQITSPSKNLIDLNSNEHEEIPDNKYFLDSSLINY